MDKKYKKVGEKGGLNIYYETMRRVKNGDGKNMIPTFYNFAIVCYQNPSLLRVKGAGRYLECY